MRRRFTHDASEGRIGTWPVIPRLGGRNIRHTVLVPTIVIRFVATEAPKAKRLHSNTRAGSPTVEEDPSQTTILGTNSARLPPPLTLQQHVTTSEPRIANTNAGHGGVEAVLRCSVEHRWEATAPSDTIRLRIRVRERWNSVPLVLDGIRRNSAAE